AADRHRDRGVPDGELAGARGVRHVRRRVRRAPGPPADSHARRLGGPPIAQGLRVGRRRHAVPRRVHPSGRREVGVVATPPEARAPVPASVAEGAPGDTYEGLREETMVINMGPQHPSTHGVLRMVLELDGENVVSVRPVVGYLHTGIEKNTEYRSWQKGVAFVTRMDYLAPIFYELEYCMEIEWLVRLEVQVRGRCIGLV